MRVRKGEWRKAQLTSHVRLTQMFSMSPLTHEAPVFVNDRCAHLQQQGSAQDVPYKQGLQNIYLHVQWRCTFHLAHFRAVFAGAPSGCSRLVLFEDAPAWRTRLA